MFPQEKVNEDGEEALFKMLEEAHSLRINNLSESIKIAELALLISRNQNNRK
jgi:hypothetical protein